jgi:hypothetical protein
MQSRVRASFAALDPHCSLLVLLPLLPPTTNCPNALALTQLAKAVEAMGAGEILLNAIDNDGKGQGFDLALVESVSRAVTIPVIASSGAGSPEHFTEVCGRERRRCWHHHANSTM